MANPRGIHKCEVAGQSRILRKSLMAVIDIEERLDTGIDEACTALEQPGKKFKQLLVIFEELCVAGGTPLTDTDRQLLDLDDAGEISRAIAGCFNAGAVKEAAHQPPKAKKSVQLKP